MAGVSPLGLGAGGALGAVRPAGVAVHAVLHLAQDHALADEALEGLGGAHGANVVQDLRQGQGSRARAAG